jgi:hypothetical protein
MIAAAWRTVCDHITPFLSLAADLRKAAPHPQHDRSELAWI